MSTQQTLHKAAQQSAPAGARTSRR